VYNTIENDLCLVGATAVEDQLQDGVADTLQSLRQAGIQVYLHEMFSGILWNIQVYVHEMFSGILWYI